MKRLRHDKRGISNVIVAMLSLVLIVIIVGNVILWSYEMNQMDWERIQEKVVLTNAEHITHSPWFTSTDEYVTNNGSLLSGTYSDTWAANDSYETFTEALAPTYAPDSYRLDIDGAFNLDLSLYPRAYMDSVEVLVRYRTSDTSDRWFIEAYNWTGQAYGDAGLNTTAGDTPSTEFKHYSVDLATDWQDYVQSNGTIRVRFRDSSPETNQTVVDIDFIGVRAEIEGTKLSLQNDGPMTCHVVAIWILNATTHKRYTTNLFFNAGTTIACVRADIALPQNTFIAKVVTEKGNIAIFTKN